MLGVEVEHGFRLSESQTVCPTRLHHSSMESMHVVVRSMDVHYKVGKFSIWLATYSKLPKVHFRDSKSYSTF